TGPPGRGWPPSRPLPPTGPYGGPHRSTRPAPGTGSGRTRPRVGEGPTPGGSAGGYWPEAWPPPGSPPLQTVAGPDRPAPAPLGWSSSGAGRDGAPAAPG